MHRYTALAGCQASVVLQITDHYHYRSFGGIGSVAAADCLRAEHPSSYHRTQQTPVELGRVSLSRGKRRSLLFFLLFSGWRV